MKHPNHFHYRVAFFSWLLGGVQLVSLDFILWHFLLFCLFPECWILTELSLASDSLLWLQSFRSFFFHLFSSFSKPPSSWCCAFVSKAKNLVASLRQSPHLQPCPRTLQTHTYRPYNFLCDNPATVFCYSSISNSTGDNNDIQMVE
jgi:hypothetical protein